MNFRDVAVLGGVGAVLLVANAACALAPTDSGPADSQDRSERVERVGFAESALRATYETGGESYRFIDTHDQYGHTGRIDKNDFLYFHKVNGKRAVGLTMDCAWVDAPNAAEVLNVLKAYSTKITFFISGPFIFQDYRRGLEGGLDRSNFANIKRMVDDGHEFGNHTQTHPHNNQSINWTRETEELERGWDAVIAEIYRGQALPTNARMTNFWRAPYGEYDTRSLGLASKGGFPNHFGWNVDVKDSVGYPDCREEPANRACLSPKKLTDTVLAFAEQNEWSLDGFVILSHLQNPYNWGSKPEGLARLLDTVRAKGHVVAKISEMFAETIPDGPHEPPPAADAAEPGDTCAEGCIYSSFCVDRNVTAKRYASADGTKLVCVKRGDCSAACVGP